MTSAHTTNPPIPTKKTYSNSTSAALSLLLLLVLSGACAGNKGVTMKGRMRILGHAAGATALYGSPSGEFWIAELRGRWMRQYRILYPHLSPGLIKLVSRKQGVRQYTMGFAMGAPDNTGRFLYVTVDKTPYAYTLRSSADEGQLPLAPPGGGYWFFHSAHFDVLSSCAVVALWQPTRRIDMAAKNDRVWLVSINPANLKVRATRSLMINLPPSSEHGKGQSVTAVGGPLSNPLLALVSAPSDKQQPPVYQLTTMNCETLETVWEQPIFSGLNPLAPKKQSTIVISSSSAQTERLLRGIRLSFTGSGKHLAVVYGSRNHGTINPYRVYFYDALSGSIAREIKPSGSPLLSSVPVTRLIQKPAKDGVLALGLPSIRHVGRSDTFMGVWELSVRGATVRELLDVSRSSLGSTWKMYKNLQPYAFGWHKGRVILAPASFARIPEHIKGTWKSPGGTDTYQDEVRAWIPRSFSVKRLNRAATKAQRWIATLK